MQCGGGDGCGSLCAWHPFVTGPLETQSRPPTSLLKLLLETSSFPEEQNSSVGRKFVHHKIHLVLAVLRVGQGEDAIIMPILQGKTASLQS